jgi:hypothetical protein
MAIDDSRGRNLSGNPVITDIETAHVGVHPEFDLNAVELASPTRTAQAFAPCSDGSREWISRSASPLR